MKKILVIRFSSLGDVVLSTAVFSNLKAKWPEAEVVVLTKKGFAGVFAGNPWIDRVIPFDPSTEPFSQLSRKIRMEKFDLIVDLHGNLRSWFLRFLAGSALVVTVDKVSWARRRLLLFKRSSPELAFSVRERILACLARIEVPVRDPDTHLFPRNAEAKLAEYNIPAHRPLLGLAPGSKHATKRWIPERFAEVVNRLSNEAEFLVVLLGDKNDRATGEELARHLTVSYVNLVGMTSLEDLIAVTSRLDLLITNDSGIGHVAEAMKRPLVSIFGPTTRGFGFGPYRETSRVVETANLECRPCSLHGDEICPLKHHRCMKEVTVDQVFTAAVSLWRSRLGQSKEGVA